MTSNAIPLRRPRVTTLPMRGDGNLQAFLKARQAMSPNPEAPPWQSMDDSGDYYIRVEADGQAAVESERTLLRDLADRTNVERAARAAMILGGSGLDDRYVRYIETAFSGYIRDAARLDPGVVIRALLTEARDRLSPVRAVAIESLGYLINGGANSGGPLPEAHVETFWVNGREFGSEVNELDNPSGYLPQYVELAADPSLELESKRQLRRNIAKHLPEIEATPRSFLGTQVVVCPMDVYAENIVAIGPAGSVAWPRDPSAPRYLIVTRNPAGPDADVWTTDTVLLRELFCGVPGREEAAEKLLRASGIDAPYVHAALQLKRSGRTWSPLESELLSYYRTGSALTKHAAAYVIQVDDRCYTAEELIEYLGELDGLNTPAAKQRGQWALEQLIQAMLNDRCGSEYSRAWRRAPILKALLSRAYAPTCKIRSDIIKALPRVIAPESLEAGALKALVSDTTLGQRSLDDLCVAIDAIDERRVTVEGASADVYAGVRVRVENLGAVAAELPLHPTESPDGQQAKEELDRIYGRVTWDRLFTIEVSGERQVQRKTGRALRRALYSLDLDAAIFAIRVLAASGLATDEVVRQSLLAVVIDRHRPEIVRQEALRAFAHLVRNDAAATHIAAILHEARTRPDLYAEALRLLAASDDNLSRYYLATPTDVLDDESEGVSADLSPDAAEGVPSAEFKLLKHIIGANLEDHEVKKIAREMPKSELARRLFEVVATANDPQRPAAIASLQKMVPPGSPYDKGLGIVAALPDVVAAKRVALDTVLGIQAAQGQ